MAKIKEIFVVYELWHINEARLRAARGTTVVCLNFWVEQELKKNNIPFVSLLDVIDIETGRDEWLLLARKIAREWYRLPAMEFFEYKGIRIAEAIEPIVEEYLSKLFYYVRIYAVLKGKYPDAHLSVPAIPVKDIQAAGCLIPFERLVAIDAARMVGLYGTIQSRPEASHAPSFLQTVWKSFLMRLYNAVINLVPPRGLKIYCSEYWSNIGTVVEQMNDAEFVLMVSGELKKIPWRQLFTYRIRIRHPDDATRDVEKRRAQQKSEEFITQWKSAKKEVAAYLVRTRRELDWNPVLQACEYLMTYASHVIVDIDALYRIMMEEKPDAILQLASVGTRWNYCFILARVAARLKIPSIELQHGVNSVDPTTSYSRLETDYLATYGMDTNSWLERLGHPRDRLVPIGSPRFDRYVNAQVAALEKGKQLFKRFGLDATRPILFASVPSSDTDFVNFDSYQLAEFFGAIRAAQDAIPTIQVLFKFRRYKYTKAAREYVQKLFPADSAIAGDEDIFALLCASDAVVCGFSTVVYEAMLAKKPLVLYPWQKIDAYNAQMYAHAAPFAHTKREVVDVLSRVFADASYRKDCLARQKHFLEGYSFDGKASERTAELIEEIARKQK